MLMILNKLPNKFTEPVPEPRDKPELTESFDHSNMHHKLSVEVTIDYNLKTRQG